MSRPAARSPKTCRRMRWRSAAPGRSSSRAGRRSGARAAPRARTAPSRRSLTTPSARRAGHGSVPEGEQRMCGIVGYVGGRDAVPVILEGLRRLEYRGYDSAGIAVVKDGAVVRRRSAGKLVNLAASLEREPLAGDFGLGHTRWA